MINLEKLNELCEELDEAYRINAGGCCYVAYLIAKNLDKLDIDWELCILNDYTLNEDSIKEEVRNNCLNCNVGSSICGENTSIHYCLKIPEFGLINKGHFNLTYYNLYFIDRIKSSDILWIYDEGFWNLDYDTDFNSEIESIINNWFDEIYFS